MSVVSLCQTIVQLSFSFTLTVIPLGMLLITSEALLQRSSLACRMSYLVWDFIFYEYNALCNAMVKHGLGFRPCWISYNRLYVVATLDSMEKNDNGGEPELYIKLKLCLFFSFVFCSFCIDFHTEQDRAGQEVWSVNVGGKRLIYIWSVTGDWRLESH